MGDYRAVVSNINSAFSNQVADTLIILDCINELGKGNFAVQFKRFPGKKVIINEIIEGVTKNFKALSNATLLLIEAVKRGDLKASIKTDFHGRLANTDYRA